MKTSLIGAAATLVLWITLTFIMRLETGWVHTPLAIAAVLVARAIVLSDAQNAKG
ncbi:MAG: hypothetical protein O7D29_12075 [Gemmatimonadetes bacterium]|nr:hypothetical protein [Gemmatimonadota bacterium]